MKTVTLGSLYFLFLNQRNLNSEMWSWGNLKYKQNTSITCHPLLFHLEVHGFFQAFYLNLSFLLKKTHTQRVSGGRNYTGDMLDNFFSYLVRMIIQGNEEDVSSCWSIHFAQTSLALPMLKWKFERKREILSYIYAVLIGL